MAQGNIHAILMPQKTCNLVCNYCYVLEKPTGRMSMALARHIIDELMAHNQPGSPTRLIWHGGEPLLAGLRFYRSICDYIRQTYPAYKVEHLIQTNGTLLTDPWIDFFLEYEFRVGVSLDGWRELHDACRRTAHGTGSYDRIFANIMHARRRGLIAGVLAVVTQHTLGHARQLFDFFAEHKLDFGFHPITSLTPEADEQLAIDPAAFADFSIEMFDLAFFQPEPRFTAATPTLHYLMAVMLGCSSGFCVLAEACAEEYISIEPSGRVHVCDRFAGNADLAFGNIATDGLEKLLNSPQRQQFLRRQETIRELCGDCRWFAVCNGGCPHEAYARYGTILSRDPNCLAYQRIFDHVADTVRQELKHDAIA